MNYVDEWLTCKYIKILIVYDRYFKVCKIITIVFQLLLSITSVSGECDSAIAQIPLHWSRNHKERAMLEGYFDLDGATGGIIVVAQTLLFLITFIFAPKHGLLASRRRAREAAC